MSVLIYVNYWDCFDAILTLDIRPSQRTLPSSLGQTKKRSRRIRDIEIKLKSSRGSFRNLGPLARVTSDRSLLMTFSMYAL